MKQNMRQRGIENEELSRTRDAKDAATRARRRAEKVASRMSFATATVSRSVTPGTMTPPLLRLTPSSQSQSERSSAAIAQDDKDSLEFVEQVEAR